MKISWIQAFLFSLCLLLTGTIIAIHSPGTGVSLMFFGMISAPIVKFIFPKLSFLKSLEGNLKKSHHLSAKCPHCHKKIPSIATRCSYCTADLTEQSVQEKIEKQLPSRFAVFLGIAMIFVIASAFSGTSSRNTQSTDPVSKAANEQKTKDDAAKQELLKKIELRPIIVDNSIGTPELHVTVRNGTNKTIDGIDLSAYFYNNFDEPIGKWNTKSSDAFIGTSSERISAGVSDSLLWNLAVYEQATKVKNVTVYRVHFTDGTSIGTDQ